MAEIHMLVAMAANRVIGKNNAMPWHLPADLKHFKRMTTGHTIIMGRKTFESIGKPLPKRTSVIITSQPHYSSQGCIIAHSLQEALHVAANEEKVFIIGGASVYLQALPYAKALHLTLIHREIEGDTHFPPIDETQWEETGREDHQPDAKNPMPYSFITYRKK